MAVKDKEVKKSPRLPEWLKRDVLLTDKSRRVHSIVQEFNLNTVCQSARCPNRDECFSGGTATFMILGNTCTRGCTFCSVPKGKPPEAPSVFEPENVATAAKLMNLNHVVITSVNRDELPDQGSMQFVKTISALREAIPNVAVEVLTPDFQGDKTCIKNVIDAAPDIFNHNLETVPSLYKEVRPGAIYERSLDLIRFVKETNSKIITKSGIMLGLGEEYDEVVRVMEDLYENECDYLTLGQYMQPTRDSLPVHRFLYPNEFQELKRIAENIGFKKVFSGPLVRSSYHAKDFHESTNNLKVAM